MKLDRVTITGADDGTDPADLLRLSERFPFVEWGLLLSASSMGRPRFPSLEWLERLVLAKGADQLQLSAHLCGRWVRDLCIGGRAIFEELSPLTGCFDRAQLNFHARRHAVDVSPLVAALKNWWPGTPSEFIFQADGVNDWLLDATLAAGLPAVPLFDLSGGQGVLPASWPAHRGEYCGYAGGLSCDNLERELGIIAAPAVAGGRRVWVDVETRVRTDDDRLLDLALVERFLEIAAPRVVKSS